MGDNVKLYKCYKGTCSKCLNEENPYFTEDEYKAFLDTEGKIQCPEGNLECGIQELKPEDYPKPPRDNKKLFIIAGGILGVLLIVAAIFLFTGKSNKQQINNIALPNLAKDTASKTIPATNQGTSSTPTTAPEKTTGNSTNNNNGDLTAGSLEDYFRKIADKSIPYDQKDGLKIGILKYFTSAKSEVVIQIDGKDAGAYPTIEDYIETLSNNNRVIKINKKDMNGEKIYKIYITEL